MVEASRTPKARASQAEEAAVYRKVGRRLLPFLLLCYTFAYLDRVNIGFAKLHMQDDIGLSEAAFGLGAGLFFLAYAFLEIPSNLLMEKIGAKRTITRIMVLWGLASAAMAFVQDETSFYVLRVLLGVFEAGFAPGIILYLTYWYSAKRMAAAMGVYMLAGPIGSILGSGFSALIISGFDGIAGLSGWQWMFLVEGIPCVFLGYLFWRTMADRPQEADWLSAREKEVIGEAVSRSRSQTTHSFAAALRNAQIYVMSVAYFGMMCGIYAISFWLPTTLQENGVEGTLTIGFLTAVPYVFAIAAMVVLGRSSDRFQDRRWHTIVPTVVAGAALLVSAMAGHVLVLSFGAMIIAVAAVWAAYTVFWAVPAEHFGGTAAAGGIALINTVGILGGFASPYLIGLVKEATGSTQIGLLVMVGLLAASTVALLLIRRPTTADAA
ncbi:sugar phosphate permease [Spinactinospora alkalitolerans]|uniref:Sugar phosphate permease n=1 Tax=Spinactinospora alkalitolerans TaxID=687207 RepID=A0A852TTW3_9ACTN|nr:MFS transporter [Spinactinospora alkalitolerans]NYE47886.1 sugar phosphate permease [Spinactinospora alkalitolerans]